MCSVKIIGVASKIDVLRLRSQKHIGHFNAEATIVSSVKIKIKPVPRGCKRRDLRRFRLVRYIFGVNQHGSGRRRLNFLPYPRLFSVG